MGDIVGTLLKKTEMAGDFKILSVSAVIASASDVIDVSGITGEIAAIVGAVITAGMDAALTTLQPSFDGTDITVVSKGADGADATDWTDAEVTITFLGT